jgi:hypothetical protein
VSIPLYLQFLRRGYSGDDACYYANQRQVMIGHSE